MKLSHRAVHPAIRRAAAVAVIAGLTGLCVADSVTVKQEVEVHPKTSALSPPVETVPADTKLERLGVEHGWVKVRTPNGNTGYIRSDDLPVIVDATTLQGNAQTNGLSTTAAGHTLQGDAETYARSNNLDPAPLKKLIATGKTISDKDLREFDAAGHLGPKEYRN